MTSDVELGAGKICFIVSPIGNKLAPVGSPGRNRYEESILMWEEVFEAATATFGLRTVRADRISETGEIPEQIFTYLRDSEVVVADLSHGNPNVMYELGLRHSRPGLITIQVGEYDALPFDLASIRTLQFNRTQAGLIGLRNDLVESLRTALEGNGTPLRATAVFAQQTDVDVDVDADAERSSEPDPTDTGEEPGSLELLADGEASAFHMLEVLQQSASLMESMSEMTQAATSEIRESDRSNKGFAGRLLVTKRLADAMESPAEEYAKLGTEFVHDVSAVDILVRLVSDRVTSGQEQAEELLPFATTILTLVESTGDVSVKVADYRDSSAQLAKLSKLLLPVSRELVGGAGRFLEGIQQMSTWKEAVRPITDIPH